MPLTCLAPDIVEAILAGTGDQALMLEQLERPLPASWKGQREQLPWKPVQAAGPSRLGPRG